MCVIASSYRSIRLCWMGASNNCLQPQSSSELKALLLSIFFFFFPGVGKNPQKSKEKACFGVVENFTAMQCTNEGIPRAEVPAFPRISSLAIPLGWTQLAHRSFGFFRRRDNEEGQACAGSHRRNAAPASAHRAARGH